MFGRGCGRKPLLQHRDEAADGGLAKDVDEVVGAGFDMLGREIEELGEVGTEALLDDIDRLMQPVGGSVDLGGLPLPLAGLAGGLVFVSGGRPASFYRPPSRAKSN